MYERKSILEYEKRVGNRRKKNGGPSSKPKVLQHKSETGLRIRREGGACKHRPARKGRKKRSLGRTRDGKKVSLKAAQGLATNGWETLRKLTNPSEKSFRHVKQGLSQEKNTQTTKKILSPRRVTALTGENSANLRKNTSSRTSSMYD